MTRSFQKLLQVSPGFDATNLVAARVLLPATKYAQRPAVARFYEDVLERLRRAPGVTGASAVSAMPLHNVGAAGALPFTVAGQPPPPTEDPLADVRIVAPGYFETMKIPLLEGRLLDERDVETGPRTSVINQTMARRYFPGPQPARPDHPEPARQERGRRRRRRRPQPGPRERAEEAGLPADAAEPVGRDGAGGAHRARLRARSPGPSSA